MANTPNLKKLYQDEVAPALMQKFGWRSRLLENHYIIILTLSIGIFYFKMVLQNTSSRKEIKL